MMVPPFALTPSWPAARKRTGTAGRLLSIAVPSSLSDSIAAPRFIALPLGRAETTTFPPNRRVNRQLSAHVVR